MTTSTCEIEGCGRGCIGTMNGVAVCDRCRVEFESVEMGAVRFGGRWHGVIGAVYTPENVALFPGLIGGAP